MCIYLTVVSLEDAKAASGKKLKTIWQKFDKQMDDLMDELAEPKLQMGEEKQKTIPEGCEDCKLHFVRCIKPRPKPLSKEDNPGMFVHSMTLQQITYMGVMESVALKQKNFPFRKKFEEFYAEYELLSPRYAQVRYY
jgi:myosin heavy subunit